MYHSFSVARAVDLIEQMYYDTFEGRTDIKKLDKLFELTLNKNIPNDAISSLRDSNNS